MSNQGLNLYRKLLWAAAALLAFAPIAAEARTLAFHFETQDAVFARPGEVSDMASSPGAYGITELSQTVVGPNNRTMSSGAMSKPWGSEDPVFSTSPYADTAGMAFAADDFNIHGAIHGAGSIDDLSSKTTRSDNPDRSIWVHRRRVPSPQAG